MLAIVIGDLSLLVGLAILLLPVLVTELSRPRDGIWGAVVLLMGLVLVTSNERLIGSPMIAVGCGSVLIARLGSEVGLSRWQQLSKEEKIRLTSIERWSTSWSQFTASLRNLLDGLGSIFRLLVPGSKKSSIKKKWVRPESTTDHERLMVEKTTIPNPLPEANEISKISNSALDDQKSFKDS